MKIAMLSPVAWRTPPRHYGPWESVVSMLTEALLRRGVDVTLFATADSKTAGRLEAVSPAGYEEDPSLIPKVWECLHIANLFERGDEFDLIHNHFDYLPLTYSAMTTTPVITTIHGFSSPGILPVYERYDAHCHYVSISDADRAPSLHYLATVHHGIDLADFTFRERPDEDAYLLFFGRIHNDKGAREAIEVAARAGVRLVMAGIIQDEAYYRDHVLPKLADGKVEFVGSAGPAERDRLLGGGLALLHPIQFDEPFGLSVIESMACGTPVIAFNRGSMPELIDDGVNGFLTATVEEMAAAVGRVKDIRRRDCRAHVERKFTVDRMADDYLRLYEELLNKRTQEVWSHGGASR